MSSIRSKVALLGAFATSALAHGTVSGFVTDGTWNQGFKLDYYYQKANGGTLPDIAAWYAEDLDNGFVAPDAYSTSDINCHINAEPGALTKSVAAGGTVEFQWTTWPHGIGPVLTYVAACNGDCSSADKTTLEWVKIDEAGYDTSTSTWAAQTLIDNNSSWTTTVPSSLTSGNYVFRHEIIALHGAGSANGAQNYPQCFNIAITGGGSDSPSGTLGTALYSADDPGILFNPYTTITSYTIPGPALYSGASSGGGSNGGSGSTASTSKAAATSTSKAASSTAAATTKATTSAAVTSAVATTKATTSAAATPVSSAPASSTNTGEDDSCDAEETATDGEDDSCEADGEDDGTGSTTSSAAAGGGGASTKTTAAPTTLQTSTRTSASSKPTTSSGSSSGGSSSSGSVALYGQCGGINYTGSTTCAEGTCKVWNDYYSQCVSS